MTHASPVIVGRQEPSGRNLYLAEIERPGAWPEEIESPRAPFVALVAMDGRGLETDEVDAFAGRLIEQGAVHVCAWGPECARVRGTFDRLTVFDDRRAVATTSLEDETLVEALWFALYAAFADEPLADPAPEVLAIVIAQPEWAAETRRRMVDADSLDEEIVGAASGAGSRSDEETIRLHEEGLLQLLARERRQRAAGLLERNGWFPIDELEGYHDRAWARLLDGGRRNAAQLARELRWRGAGDTCVLVEDGGRLRRFLALGEALAAAAKKRTAFVISCRPGRLAYYGGRDELGGLLLQRARRAKPDWVSELGALAARKATLLRVFGEIYDHRRSSELDDPWPEGRWREDWLRAVSGRLLPLSDCDWPITLWLEFSDSPVLRFSGPPQGEGFELALEPDAPRDTTEAHEPAGFFVKELTALPPFAAVAGARLRALNVLVEPDPHDESEDARASARTEPEPYVPAPEPPAWVDRQPNDVPVGMRLQLERGEIWMLNVADEMEIYGQPPRLWPGGGELREYSTASEG